jgi:hypothetical protein
LLLDQSLNLPTIMVPTGDEEEPSALKKETREESLGKVDAEGHETTTTTTTEALVRPSCRDVSIAVETDASVVLHDPPPFIKDGPNMENDEEKKQDSNVKVFRDDIHFQEMMSSAGQSSTADFCLLSSQEENRKPHQLLQKDNSSASTTPQQQQQLPTTTIPSKRESRSQPSKRSPNTNHSSSSACLPRPTPSAAATTATAAATRRRTKGRKSSDEEHDMASLSETTGLQGMNTQTSDQKRPTASLATTNNANDGNENGSWTGGSTHPEQKVHQQHERHVQHLLNDNGASLVTTLTRLDQPGAFRICPNGQGGGHGHDDDATVIPNDVENAMTTPSFLPPRDNHSAASGSTNRSYSMPTDPTSAQYRAIEWLAEYHPPSDVTSDEDIDVWIQYYVLVTFYYQAGGETGQWSNDRLWLSTEPLCDWAMIICNDSRISDDWVYQESGNEKP